MRDELLYDGASSLTFDVDIAGASVTGTTAEQVLSTLLLPPLPVGCVVRTHMLIEWTSNANNKNPRLRLGSISGTLLFAPTVTINGYIGAGIMLYITGNSTAIVLNTSSFLSQAASLISVTGQDWATPTPFLITGQLANAADVLSLRAGVVELLNYRPPA